MNPCTLGILEDLDPRDWRVHKFGLTASRSERLRGKDYWITGAGTGFGRAIATALASCGARIFLTGRRRSKLVETVDQIASFGIPTERCHIVPADIGDAEQVGQAM